LAGQNKKEVVSKVRLIVILSLAKYWQST